MWVGVGLLFGVGWSVSGRESGTQKRVFLEGRDIYVYYFNDIRQGAL